MTSRNASIAVIVNPVTSEAEAAEVSELLTRRAIAAIWLETTEDDPGVGQSRAAVADGADLVIACGGDGTVRACVESLAGTATALAVVPAGTGNLLAKNLGIPEDPARAFDVALGGSRRKIDVGYANGEAFAVMAGAGLDAVIMSNTPRDAKDRFGVLAYIKTALEHLGDAPTRAVASADGGPVFSGKAATILAANFGQIQGGIDLAPDSDPADGRLDFVAVRAETIATWIKTATAVLAGRAGVDSMQRWAASAADVTFGTPTLYELDGEERPPTRRLKFSVDKESLTVCVPEEPR